MVRRIALLLALATISIASRVVASPDAWWDAEAPCPEGASLRDVGVSRVCLLDRDASVRHGRFATRSWNDSRSLIVFVEGQWDMGQRDGEWTYRGRDGKVIDRMVFKKGTGAFRRWFVDGGRRSEGQMKRGKRVGTWTFWAMDERIVLTQRHGKNGKFISSMLQVDGRRIVDKVVIATVSLALGVQDDTPESDEWRFDHQKEIGLMGVEPVSSGLLRGVLDKHGREEIRADSIGMTATGCPKAELTDAQVTRVFHGRRGVLRACFTDAMQKRPKARAEAEAQVTITSDGTPSSVKATSGLGQELASCLEQTVKLMRFPPLQNTETCAISIRFESRDADASQQ